MCTLETRVHMTDLIRSNNSAVSFFLISDFIPVVTSEVKGQKSIFLLNKLQIDFVSLLIVSYFCSFLLEDIQKHQNRKTHLNKGHYSLKVPLFTFKLFKHLTFYFCLPRKLHLYPCILLRS